MDTRSNVSSDLFRCVLVQASVPGYSTQAFGRYVSPSGNGLYARQLLTFYVLDEIIVKAVSGTPSPAAHLLWGRGRTPVNMFTRMPLP